MEWDTIIIPVLIAFEVLSLTLYQIDHYPNRKRNTKGSQDKVTHELSLTGYVGGLGSVEKVCAEHLRRDGKDRQEEPCVCKGAGMFKK